MAVAMLAALMAPPAARPAAMRVAGRRVPPVAVLRVLLLVLLLGYTPATVDVVSAALIASSKIEYCTNTGTEPVACTRKMVVTLTVDAGQLAGTEEVVAISTAVDETSNGETRQFSPMRLTASRSLVRYRYPIFYVQAYNAKPYEATVKGTVARQCNADADARSATCGVSQTPNGVAIPFSQGFCCDCGLCATLGMCADDARAVGACSVLDAYTQASCLRFGSRWYSGYAIGTSSPHYSLNVSMARNTTVPLPDSTSGSGVVGRVVETESTLFLSPGSVGDANTTFGVAARLIGSFSPAEQPLVLTQSMLFTPSLPREDPRVVDGPKEWMILDKSLVSLDGRTCNKVGTSFEAFASQGNACRLSTGSCLSSQLEDLREADMAAIASGRKGVYMAQSLGRFSTSDLTETQPTYGSGSPSPAPYISYLASSPGATMVTLTLVADDLQYVVSLAPGIIRSLAMNVDVLNASTRDGELTVTVENTGAVTARFTVGVACGMEVFPMPAQVLSLAARQVQAVVFSVLVQREDTNGTLTCTATLRDALEVIQDVGSVDFLVRPRRETNGTQGGSGPADGGGAVEGTSSARCSKCGFLSLSCVYANVCVGLLMAQVGMLLGTLAALLLALAFRGPITHCLGGLLCLYRKRGHAGGYGGSAARGVAVARTTDAQRACPSSHACSGTSGAGSVDLARLLLQQQQQLNTITRSLRVSECGGGRDGCGCEDGRRCCTGCAPVMGSRGCAGKVLALTHRAACATPGAMTPMGSERGFGRSAPRGHGVSQSSHRRHQSAGRSVSPSSRAMGDDDDGCLPGMSYRRRSLSASPPLSLYRDTYELGGDTGYAPHRGYTRATATVPQGHSRQEYLPRRESRRGSYRADDASNVLMASYGGAVYRDDYPHPRSEQQHQQEEWEEPYHSIDVMDEYDEDAVEYSGSSPAFDEERGHHLSRYRRPLSRGGARRGPSRAPFAPY